MMDRVNKRVYDLKGGNDMIWKIECIKFSYDLINDL